MKETKIVRKIDEIGRIVLPPDYRHALGWHEGSKVAVIHEGEQIILRSFQNCCFVCGKGEDLTPIREKHICADCIHEINSQNE